MALTGFFGAALAALVQQDHDPATASHGADALAHGAEAAAHFEPTLLWAIVLLPLLGFVINGVAAFRAPAHKTIPSVVGPLVIALAFLLGMTPSMAALAQPPDPFTEFF